ATRYLLMLKRTAWALLAQSSSGMSDAGKMGGGDGYEALARRPCPGCDWCMLRGDVAAAVVRARWSNCRCSNTAGGIAASAGPAIADTQRWRALSRRQAIRRPGRSGERQLPALVSDPGDRHL